MVAYPLGARRMVRRFVVRKRIGDTVKFFQTCCWEEVCQNVSSFDGIDISHINKMVPVNFVSTEDFWSTANYSYGV